MRRTVGMSFRPVNNIHRVRSDSFYSSTDSELIQVDIFRRKILIVTNLFLMFGNRNYRAYCSLILSRSVRLGTEWSRVKSNIVYIEIKIII